MLPRKPLAPSHKMVFTMEGRRAEYRVPDATKWVSSHLKVTKSRTAFIMKDMETGYLFALRGLRSAYPETPAEKIKQLQTEITGIFKNTITKGKTESQIKKEIFGRLDDMLTKRMTEKQANFYLGLLQQLTNYKLTNAIR
jgi:hypothetical protein